MCGKGKRSESFIDAEWYNGSSVAILVEFFKNSGPNTIQKIDSVYFTDFLKFSTARSISFIQVLSKVLLCVD